MPSPSSPRCYQVRRLIRAALLATAAAMTLSPAYAQNDPGYASYKVIKHPGRAPLVYYYAGTDRDLTNPSMVSVAGKRFLIDFGVRPPTVNSVFLLEHSEVRPNESVLDMGTGTGLHGIFSAIAGATVVATDIDPLAIDNAKRNARAHQVTDKMDFRVGDLFGVLKPDEQFDVIFLNVAYPFDNSQLDRWNLHERFFAGVGKHLKPNGRIYYQIGFIDNLPYTQKMLAKNGLHVMRMEMARAIETEREPIMMMVQRVADTEKGRPNTNPTANETLPPTTSGAPAPTPAR